MSTSGWELHQADAVDWLRTLAPDSVDLVITDPPYESLEKHRAVGTTTRLKHSKASSNDWFRIFPNDRFPALFAELFRVLRPDRHFYLFCDPETAFVAKPVAEQAGFKFWKPLVWDKQRIGMGYHYRARYEFILFFEKKGKRKSGRQLADLGTSDVISVPRVHKGYPAEKPLPVLDLLVRQSARAGELVIDPFMGSGSTGLAAVNQGCRFTGNDIADASLDLTRRRLELVTASAPSAATTASPPTSVPRPLALALPLPGPAALQPTPPSPRMVSGRAG